MVDSILVMRKLSEMEQYLDQTREFAALSLEEYSGKILRKHLEDFLLFRDAILRQLTCAGDEVSL